jgi:hypothetical protein
MQRQPGQIVHETLPQEKKSCKRAGGVAESVDPAFKPSTTKKQKKKKRKRKPQEGYVVAHGRSMLEFWS